MCRLSTFRHVLYEDRSRRRALPWAGPGTAQAVMVILLVVCLAASSLGFCLGVALVTNVGGWAERVAQRNRARHEKRLLVNGQAPTTLHDARIRGMVMLWFSG